MSIFERIDCAIISRLYVASTDQVMNTEIFPWPNFNVAKVFTEMIHFHIRGMASDKGIHYLKQKMPQAIDLSKHRRS